MTEKQKKITAALTAVTYYIKSGEEATLRRIEAQPENLPGPWSLYGRQLIMQNRDLMQRRVIKR